MMNIDRAFVRRLRIALAIAAACGMVALEAQAPARIYPSSKRPIESNAYLAPMPGSTPWAPAWSPDGRWLAVGMHGSIWKVNRATAIAYELTYDKKFHAAPAWSPDGRWIVYTAEDGGSTIQLEALNVESGKAQPLTTDAFVYTDPAFSPDGTRLAYVSTNPTGSLHVYVRPIKDGAWAGPAIAVTESARPVADGDATPPLYLQPAWTRDGKDLLIVSNRNVKDIPGAADLGNSLAGEILRVPAAAGGIAQARAVVTGAESFYRARPDVSIDGTRIVFSSTRGSADRYQNLYFQSLAGGDPAKITFFAHDAFHPRWSPDGETIAFITNEGGLPQLALLETYYGAIETVRVADYRWKRPMGTLSVRTVDAASGQVVPARIHLIPSDGKFYAPNDAFALMGRVGERAFHASGTFTVSVPTGAVRLTAVRGFEYAPATAEAQVAAGDVVEITVRLERVADLRARGWYNGSMHSHMNYEGSFNQTPESYMRVAAAEGQDVVTTQVVDYGSRILDYQHFVRGAAHPISTADRLLLVGQEPRPPLYGHLVLFGMKDHLTTPVRWGGTGGSSLYPTPTDIFRNARTQGATVGYDHSFGGDADPLQGNLGQAAGLMVDVALGTADVVTWNNAARAGFFPVYAAWNNGLKIVAMGGEDAILNAQHRRALSGGTRTYVFLGSRPLSMDNWLASLRAGHAFVTTGPLVQLTVNGAMPGEEVTLPASGANVDVDASVRSIAPLEKAQLVFNGAVVEEVPLSPDRKSASLRKSLRVTQSGWYHLRTEGRPADRFPLDAEYPQAFTNPVWVKVGTLPIRNRESADYGMRWVDKLQQIATTMGLWRSEAEKKHTLAVFDEARQVYRRLAGEATTSSASRP